MADLHPVSWTDFNHKRWLQPSSMAFARHDNMAVIGLHEVARLIMQLPLGFVRTEGGFQAVVLMGFQQGQNLVVSPQGQWLAEYVPTVYRCYPFAMAQSVEGKSVLCVDKASGLVHEGPIGFRFFDEEKKPTPELNEVITSLRQLQSDRILMARACKLLDAQGVIESWPLQLKTGEGTQAVDGLYRISESRFNQLTGDVLVELRSCGGLTLCLGQLFSMQHIQQLGSIALRQSWAKKGEGQLAPALNIGEEDGILSFTNL